MRKSDYAIVVTCNPGYSFGLLSTMNAQMYFGTNADWEIAYEGFPDEYRKKVSDSYPFNVNWTPLQDLMVNVVDKRTDQRGPLERYWIGYWALAHKLLKEGKYKAVCVTQADQFTFVNLDWYLHAAEHGFMASAEYHATQKRVYALPFGDDKAIWDRCQCSIFDNLNFIGPQHLDMAWDVIEMQTVDPFQGEASHSVITLNRSVCKHLKNTQVISLDGDQWSCDCNWADRVFKRGEGCDTVFDQNGMQIKGWHCRWWQKGRVLGEWEGSKGAILANKDNPDFMRKINNIEINMLLVNSFMTWFHNMKPELKLDLESGGHFRRPRYEDGE